MLMIQKFHFLRGEGKKLSVLDMVFFDLDLREVGFNEINHFIEDTGIVVRVGGEEGAAEPGGLPDVLQANLCGGQVEFLVQTCEDGGQE